MSEHDSVAVQAVAIAAARVGEPRKTELARPVPREVLAFKLGAEEYGLDILRVQELRSYEPPTRIANSPAFIKGVINLRGVIVPVVDMRLKFGLNDGVCNETTVVIVLSLGARTVGMVVDSVSDVVSIAPEHVRPVPEFSSAVASEHLLGIGVIDARMLILIDIQKLMSSDDMGFANPMEQA